MQIVIIRKFVEREDAVQLTVYSRLSEGRDFKDKLVLDMIYDRSDEHLDVRVCNLTLTAFNREFQGLLSYLKML